MHHNACLRNNTKWVRLILIPFAVGGVALENSKLEGIMFDTCVHCFISCSHNIHPLNISRDVEGLYTHGRHNHPISNGMCREALNIAYKCVANEVMKTPIAKNFALVMATSKHFFGILPFELSHK